MLTTPLPTVFSSHRTYVGYECECEPWIFDQGGNFYLSQSFRDGGSCPSWFVLAEEPKVFWAQRWSLPPESAQNYIARRAISTYKVLDPAMHMYLIVLPAATCLSPMTFRNGLKPSLVRS